MRKRYLATITAAALVGLAAATASGFTGGGSNADRYYPKTWSTYAANPERNAAFDVSKDAPLPVRQGVSWKFKEDAALPLNGGPYDEGVLGYLPSSVKTTQMMGNAVGVTVAGGRVFAESDMGKVYAMDAVTGHKLWEATTVNEAMGDPVVADGLVFVGAGDTGFSFTAMQAYVAGKPVTRGMGFAAVYAFDERTGRQVWKYSTKGEDMPSVQYLDGKVYFGNGDGHMYALDAKTGKAAWVSNVGGFDSMSSANLWHDPATGKNLVLAGFSDPNYVIAVDAATGAVAWKSTISGVYNTGMGDNSPTVDSKNGIVLQNSVVNYDPATKTSDLAEFATDAHTGQVLWTTDLGRGPSPLAYKAAITMVHNGVAYAGNPATGKTSALDVKTGKLLWQTDLGTYTWQGTTYQIQSRGGPTLYHNVLYQAAGAYVFAMDPKTGKVLSRVDAGGRYGIVNPVIVGGTMYLGNSYDWVLAIPMSKIYSGWNSH